MPGGDELGGVPGRLEFAEVADRNTDAREARGLGREEAAGELDVEARGVGCRGVEGEATFSLNSARRPSFSSAALTLPLAVASESAGVLPLAGALPLADLNIPPKKPKLAGAVPAPRSFAALRGIGGASFSIGGGGGEGRGWMEEVGEGEGESSRSSRRELGVTVEPRVGPGRGGVVVAAVPLPNEV